LKMQHIMFICIKLFKKNLKISKKMSNGNFSLFLNPKWKNSDIFQALSSEYFISYNLKLLNFNPKQNLRKPIPVFLR
jgi:hypothetical protein